MELTQEQTQEPRRKPFNGPTFTETILADGEPTIVVWYATHTQKELGKTYAVIVDIEISKRLTRLPRSSIALVLKAAIAATAEDMTLLYPCTRKLLRRVEPLYMRTIIQSYKLGYEHLRFSPHGSKHPFLILRHPND